MWRSVDQAEAAVRAADELGGPTAELPSLCRRLQAAAVGPRPGAAGGAGRAGADASRAPRSIEVMRAAGDVQRAAVASASDANGQRVRDLTRDADHEIQLLDAGLAVGPGRAAPPAPLTGRRADRPRRTRRRGRCAGQAGVASTSVTAPASTASPSASSSGSMTSGGSRRITLP